MKGANPTPYIAPGPSEARLAVGDEMLGLNVWNHLSYEYISVAILYALHLSLPFLRWHSLLTTDKTQQLLDCWKFSLLSLKMLDKSGASTLWMEGVPLNGTI